VLSQSFVRLYLLKIIICILYVTLYTFVGCVKPNIFPDENHQFESRLPKRYDSVLIVRAHGLTPKSCSYFVISHPVASLVIINIKLQFPITKSISINKFTLPFVGTNGICNSNHNVQNEQYESYNFQILVRNSSFNVQKNEEIFRLHVFTNEEE
jgi:hypothetical protein